MVADATPTLLSPQHEKSPHPWERGTTPTMEEDEDDIRHALSDEEEEEEQTLEQVTDRYFEFINRCGVVDSEMSGISATGKYDEYKKFAKTADMEKCVFVQCEKRGTLLTEGEKKTAFQLDQQEQEIFTAQKLSSNNRLSSKHNPLFAIVARLSCLTNSKTNPDGATSTASVNNKTTSTTTTSDTTTATTPNTSLQETNGSDPKSRVESLIKKLNERFSTEPDSTHACLRGVILDPELHEAFLLANDEETKKTFYDTVQMVKNYQLVFEICLKEENLEKELPKVLELVETVSTEIVIKIDLSSNSFITGLSGTGTTTTTTGATSSFNLIQALTEAEARLEQEEVASGVEQQTASTTMTHDPVEVLTILEKIAKHRHVHCKLLGHEEKLTKACLRWFGPDRCMFATSWNDGEVTHNPSLDKISIQMKRVIQAVVESYLEEHGLRDRPSSRESCWTMGFPQNWSSEDQKLDLRTRITLEKIFRKNAERKYIM